MKACPMENIEDRVRQLIANQLKVGASNLTDEARFVEDLKATSLDIVEMIMALEDAFEVEISDTDAEKMHTVQDVVACMAAKQNV